MQSSDDAVYLREYLETVQLQGTLVQAAMVIHDGESSSSSRN